MLKIIHILILKKTLMINILNFNVKVNLSNYATKADIKNISHVDTSRFALKKCLKTV